MQGSTQMKIKAGFVTNSSSSNFVISLWSINKLQRWAIENHMLITEKLLLGSNAGYTSEGDRWRIEIDEHHIKGFTYMDNFDMREFLMLIGVDSENIEWDSENG